MASYLFVYTKPSDYFIGQDCEIQGSGWRRKFLFLETMTFKLGYTSMFLTSVVEILCHVITCLFIGQLNLPRNLHK